MNLDLVGKMAELQDDMTPLQIGSSGVYDGKNFDVIGRLKVGYSDGVWNEWYTIFADGGEGWLAEAQGFWAMCFPVNPKDAYLPNLDKIKPGLSMTIPSYGSFDVSDIREVVCRYSEGELPMNAVQRRTSTSVDLTGGDDEFATIEYAQDCTRIFVGAYQDFDEFKFQYLRELDGW